MVILVKLVWPQKNVGTHLHGKKVQIMIIKLYLLCFLNHTAINFDNFLPSWHRKIYPE